MVLKSQNVFDTIKKIMDEQGGVPDVVKKIQGVYHFHIYKKKGGPTTAWTVDLKNGNGRLLLPFLLYRVRLYQRRHHRWRFHESGCPVHCL